MKCKNSHDLTGPASELPLAQTTASTLTRANTGFVPLNQYGQRIDLALPERNAAALKALKEHDLDILCKSFHLTGSCEEKDCSKTHGCVTVDVLLALRHLARGVGCNKGSDCRMQDCFRAHMCHKDECFSTPKHICGVGKDLHFIDAQVRFWTPPTRASKPPIQWSDREAAGPDHVNSHSEAPKTDSCDAKEGSTHGGTDTISVKSTIGEEEDLIVFD